MKRYACALALLCLSSTMTSRAQAAAIEPNSFDRVKAAPPLHALLRDGYDRSATLREVVDEIGASGWLVFVQTGQCPEKAATACLLHFIGRFDDTPYLRVIVRHRHRHPDNVIASVAHELQHAREVLMAPAATDAAAIRNRFKQIGNVSVQRAGVTTYETAAALAVGEAVWRELLRNTRSKILNSCGDVCNDERTNDPVIARVYEHFRDAPPPFVLAVGSGHFPPKVWERVKNLVAFRLHRPRADGTTVADAAIYLVRDSDIYDKAAAALRSGTTRHEYVWCLLAAVLAHESKHTTLMTEREALMAEAEQLRRCLFAGHLYAGAAGVP